MELGEAQLEVATDPHAHRRVGIEERLERDARERRALEHRLADA